MSLASPAWLAYRYLAASMPREARDWQPDQVAMRFRDTQARILRYDADWAHALASHTQGGVVNRWMKGDYQGQWRWLKPSAEYAVTWVLETRALPPGQAKRVELLARAFLSYKKYPGDVLAWWVKHRPLLDLFFEAEGWREKVFSPAHEGEGGAHAVQEVFTVGPFTVHNTLHLTGDKLQGTRDTVEKAVKAIQSRGVRLSKVLYGDVRVVGKIQAGNAMAWYYPSVDEVYLRPILRYKSDIVHNLCHELGHRFFNKEMSQTQQHEWVHEYNFRRRSPSAIKMPVSGDELPIPVKGGGKSPTVDRVEGDRVYLVSGGWVSRAKLYQMLMELAAFPTAYAATKSGEYFAECFAMYCLGTLDASHTASFERIVRP